MIRAWEQANQIDVDSAIGCTARARALAYFSFLMRLLRKWSGGEAEQDAAGGVA